MKNLFQSSFIEHNSGSKEEAKFESPFDLENVKK